MAKFVKEQEGGIAEYVIVLGLVALIAIVLGPKLKGFFTKYSDCGDKNMTGSLNGAATATAC